MNRAHKTEVCMYVVCVQTALSISDSPSLPFSLGLPVLWDTTLLKLDQLITFQCPLECSSGRKSCISLTLNKKLEMITLSKEAMLKLQMMVSIFLGIKCVSVKVFLDINNTITWA